ncbi:hypothetical protein ACFSKU_02630 [Pontibacter silvestris]|uniref:tRNA (Guanine-N1)-methyltransferase n=1 Tax=Pontibacter silvestris TaxID=2305183 RepID=A0ABW4WSQ0_9BACT|nr:hypothetical protein [Pontibacter silvestris]MCC9137709.1 hypothetical protein [Pontibacter silvestris]
MKALLYPLLFLLTFSVTTAKAQQTTTEEGTTPAPLARQFNNLKNNSNSYRENNQDYKVVNVNALNAFWTSVQESIKATAQGLVDDRKSAEQELTEARATIESQNQQIQALKQENAQKEEEVQKSEHAVNNLSVLGIDMHKQFYVFLSIGIIVALLILLAVMMLQYKNSKRVAVEKQKAFDAVDEEYNTHKKATREKELKLKRNLQTEMNRIEELNQEIATLKKQPRY